MSAVSIRSYLPGFSSNYPAQRLAYLVCVAGGNPGSIRRAAITMSSYRGVA